MQPQPASWFCPRCGVSNWSAATQCTRCGSPSPFQQQVYYSPPPVHVFVEIPKSRAAYIVLGLFLGGLGIHNFYAGRIGSGIAQLLITIFTFWLIIPIFIIWLWVIIEVIVVNRDGHGRPMS
jgi:TM2 domain-containing membrane protein YozV